MNFDNAVQSATKQGFRLAIYNDSDTENPREFGPDSVMVSFHRNCSLPNESDYDKNDFPSFSEMRKQFEKEFDIACILPIWLYDHSGVSLSTSRTCQWDSMQVGFIYITKQALRIQHKCKNITKKILKLAEENLEAEIDIYGKYMNGDAYGFVLEELKVYSEVKTYSNGETVELEDLEEWNEIDSCWGFYDVKDIKDNLPKEHAHLVDELKY